MPHDEEPQEQPFVTAGFVPTDDPELDALDILVLWEDVAVVVSVIDGMLEPAIAQALAEPRFGGEIRLVVPEEFVPANRANRRALEQAEARWNEALAGRATSAGRPLGAKVRREAK